MINLYDYTVCDAKLQNGLAVASLPRTRLSHYGQGEAVIHLYNRGVRAIIRVYKEGVY